MAVEATPDAAEWTRLVRLTVQEVASGMRTAGQVGGQHAITKENSDWTQRGDVGNDPMGVLSTLGDDNWTFYRAAFGAVDAPATKGDADDGMSTQEEAKAYYGARRTQGAKQLWTPRALPLWARPFVLNSSASGWVISEGAMAGVSDQRLAVFGVETQAFHTRAQ